MFIKRLLLSIFVMASFGFALSGQDLDAATAIAWSPDGRVLALGGIKNGQSGIWFYNPDTQNFDNVIPTDGMPLTLVWKPDGNQIFAHMGGNLEGRESHEIYNTMTGELQSPFSTTIRYAFDIIWNESSILLQDNNLLSFRSNIDGSEILNFSTFMDVIEWDEKRGRIYGRGFPSDGINYSTSVLVIDDSTGNLVQEFPYVEAIFDIAISPNGETLAVSGAGGLISLIDVFSGNTLQGSG